MGYVIMGVFIIVIFATQHLPEGYKAETPTSNDTEESGQ